MQTILLALIAGLLLTNLIIKVLEWEESWSKSSVGSTLLLFILYIPVLILTTLVAGAVFFGIAWGLAATGSMFGFTL